MYQPLDRKFELARPGNTFIALNLLARICNDAALAAATGPVLWAPGKGAFAELSAYTTLAHAREVWERAYKVYARPRTPSHRPAPTGPLDGGAELEAVVSDPLVRLLQYTGRTLHPFDLRTGAVARDLGLEEYYSREDGVHPSSSTFVATGRHATSPDEFEGACRPWTNLALARSLDHLVGHSWFFDVSHIEGASRDPTLRASVQVLKAAACAMVFALQPVILIAQLMERVRQYDVLADDLKVTLRQYSSDSWTAMTSNWAQLKLHPMFAALGWGIAKGTVMSPWGPLASYPVPEFMATPFLYVKPGPVLGRVDLEAAFGPGSEYERRTLELHQLFAIQELADAYSTIATTSGFVTMASTPISPEVSDSTRPAVVETDGLHASTSVGYPDLTRAEFVNARTFVRGTLEGGPPRTETIVPLDGRQLTLLVEREYRLTGAHLEAGVLDPREFLPLVEHRLDLDTQVLPCTLKTFADLLNMEEDELAERIRSPRGAAWAHLFSVSDDGGVAPRFSTVFRSTRTRVGLVDDYVALWREVTQVITLFQGIRRLEELRAFGYAYGDPGQPMLSSDVRARFTEYLRALGLAADNKAALLRPALRGAGAET